MVLGLLDQLQIYPVVSDKTTRAFNMSGATQAVTFIYPRLLTGFVMLVLFINLSPMEFQVRYLALFLLFAVIDGFKWFWMENLHMNIQLMLFLLYINDLPDNVICDIAIYADDTTLYCKCDQVSDLWQHLEVASELESDLPDTVN